MKKKNYNLLSLSFLMFVFTIVPNLVFSQGVLIQESAKDKEEKVNPSAILEVRSTDKGLLIPSMTSLQREAIVLPANGLMVFDTDEACFYYYDATKEGKAGWVKTVSGDANIESGTAGKIAYFQDATTISAHSAVELSNLTDEPIFVVKNSLGQTVFAVYEKGVRIYVDSDTVTTGKTARGGFAVGGFTTGKADLDFLKVTPDSVRVYIDDSPEKTARGGFAVGGFTTAKSSQEFLRITPDSARIYLNDSPSKTARGGFAVGGFTTGKDKSTAINFMFLTPENYFIGHESGDKTIPGIGNTGLYNTFFGYTAGKENIYGHSNVFIGNKSGFNNLGDSENDNLGSKNIFLGTQSGFSNTKGYNNVFLGNQSGFSNDIGLSNVFIGNAAGYSNQSITLPQGSGNVFIGDSVGYNSRYGYTNVFVGFAAGKMNYDGHANIFIGYQSGLNNNDGSYNLFLGYQSGRDMIDGTGNTFLGNNAGVDAVGGNDNIFVGPLAGRNQSLGDNNVYLGNLAGAGQSTTITNRGSENIYIGSNAGTRNTTGKNNVFLGYNAGSNNTIGEYNVFLGNQAGLNGANMLRSVYIGFNAGYSSSGDDNILIGSESGYSNSGTNNVFLGNNSGYNNTGDENIIIGNNAAYRKTQGNRGVFIGNNAGYYQEINNNSVFIGDYAGYGYEDGYAFTYPSTNICIGPSSGYTLGNQSSYNVFMGYESGYHIGESSSGNIILGAWAGKSIGKTNNNNNYNVIIGYQKSPTVEGTGNVMIGNGTYTTTTRNVSGSIYIGNQAGDQENTSNKLYIDNSNTTTPLIYGDFAANALRIHGSLSFNSGTNAITLPTTRGSTGQVLATNATTGNAYWTSITGEATTASNGLTINSRDVRLGGTLSYSTTVNLGSYNMIYNMNGSGDFEVRDNGATSFLVRDNGNVGVGTSLPLAKLQVQSASSTTIPQVLIKDNSYSYARLSFENYYGSSYYWTIAGLPHSTSSSANLNFYFSGAGDVLSLRGNGRVGIMRAPSANTLEVNGNASKTTSGSWLANSDARIKTEITEIENALDVIMALRPVKFKYSDYWKERNPSVEDHFYYNFIAQEFQQIFPEAVKGSGEFIENDSEEILQIDVHNAQIVTVKAVQELNEKIEILETENAELRKRLDKIEKLISQ